MGSDGKSLTLADVVTLQRGTTYKSALLGKPGPVLLGLASIRRNGGFRDDNLKTYGGDSPEKLTLRPGDIYVSLKDVTQSADLLGSIARVPPHVPAGRVTQDTVKLSFVRKDIPSRYLYWLLRTPIYREYCRAHAIGTTNLSLSRDDFLAFPVPKPNARQLTLVDTLDALDDKIELNRRMNEALRSFVQTLFRSWFVDFDPVNEKASGRVPRGMDLATAALLPSKFEDSRLGLIPCKWSAVKLSDITTKIGSGATPRGGSSVYTEKGVALIRSQNVYDHEFYWEGLVRLTEKSASELDGVEVRRNDVLFNITGASMLRSCIVDPAALPARVNQHVAIIRAKEGIPPHFLHLFLVQPGLKALLSGLDAGATRQAVTKGHLEALDVLRPPAEILQAFDRMTEPFFKRIELLSAESRTLAELRDALLPKLLSGELRVKPAAKLVEAKL